MAMSMLRMRVRGGIKSKMFSHHPLVYDNVPWYLRHCSNFIAAQRAGSLNRGVCSKWTLLHALSKKCWIQLKNFLIKLGISATKLIHYKRTMWRWVCNCAYKFLDGLLKGRQLIIDELCQCRPIISKKDVNIKILGTLFEKIVSSIYCSHGYHWIKIFGKVLTI